MDVVLIALVELNHSRFAIIVSINKGKNLVFFDFDTGIAVGSEIADSTTFSNVLQLFSLNIKNEDSIVTRRIRSHNDYFGLIQGTGGNVVTRSEFVLLDCKNSPLFLLLFLDFFFES